jgi:hypothetical protein
MLLPAARELLASNPTLDLGALALLPLLMAMLCASWFLRGASETIAR